LCFILLVEFAQVRALIIIMWSCEDFLDKLPPYFKFAFPATGGVIFDNHERCHSRYFRTENLWAYTGVDHDWTFDDSRDLVEEVMIIIQRECDMGVTKCFPIRTGESELGLVMPWLKKKFCAVRWGASPFRHCVNHPA